MKKFSIITLFLLLGINNLQAQDTHTEEEKKAIHEKAKQHLTGQQKKTTLKRGTKEYDLCLNKLNALYKKMANSESFQEELYLHKDFDKKLNQKIDSSLYREQFAFFPWIDQNINSTEFRNAEVAKEDWLKLRAAQDKMIADNHDFFDYFNELSLTYENYYDLFADMTTTEKDVQKNKNQ